MQLRTTGSLVALVLAAALQTWAGVAAADELCGAGSGPVGLNAAQTSDDEHTSLLTRPLQRQQRISAGFDAAMPSQGGGQNLLLPGSRPEVGATAIPAGLKAQVDQVNECLGQGMPEEGTAKPSEWVPFKDLARGLQQGSGTVPSWWLHNPRVASQMRPAAVVFAKNPAEVAHAVRCAVLANLSVSGQSGRHAYTAYCRNFCVLVNVMHMKQVSVDARAQTAVLGAGLNLGQAYTYLNDRGFTIPGGTCPTVGLAGLTLGGGKGILTRLHGLLIDKLFGLEFVLSNGTIVVANTTTFPDLLWLAKGGGGNTFPGVVTAFHFNLVKVPEVVTEYGASWCFGEGTPPDLSLGFKALRVYQDSYVANPDRSIYVRLELWPYTSTLSTGTLCRYRVSMSFKFLNIGRNEATHFLEPAFRELGRPQDESWLEHPYIRALQMGGGIGMPAGIQGCPLWPQYGGSLTEEGARELMTKSEPPWCGYDSGFDTYMKYRALVTSKFSQSAIRELINWVEQAPAFDSKDRSWNFYFQIDPSNGAAGDVAPNATAYPWRAEDDMTMQVIAKWGSDMDGPSFYGRNGNPELEGYNFGLIAALQPYVGVRSYYNYADDDMPGGAVPLDAYFGSNAQEVVRIRDEYTDERAGNGEEWELLPYRVGQIDKLQPVSAALAAAALERANGSFPSHDPTLADGS